jgi:hypothetical protein
MIPLPPYTLTAHTGIRIKFISYALGLFHFSGMENLQMTPPSLEEKIFDNIHWPASYRRMWPIKKVELISEWAPTFTGPHCTAL